MLNKNRRFRQRAISMLDVLVAFGCATVIIGVVTFGALTGINAEARAQESIIASQCARQVIENVRVIKGANVAPGTYTNATSLGPIPQLGRLSVSSASANVTTYSGSTLQVVVTVTWRSRISRTTRTTSLTAVVAPNGASL